MTSRPEAAIDFQVVIVGGGPTGLALAIELGKKGVACAVFEQNATTSTFPKASANGARTLEHYRRLGIVEGIRRIGFPHETAYFTRLAQYELARFRLSGMDSLTRDDDAPGTWFTPELPQRMQQIRVEKFLHDYAATIAGISLRYGWRVTAVQDLGDAVEIKIEDVNTGATEALRSKFVVGCDGPRGLVRRSQGIRYRGEGGVEREFMGGQMVSTHFRARELYAMAKGSPATMYWTFNRTRRAVLISANGRDEFFMFSQVTPGSELADATVRDFVRAAVGTDTTVDIIASKPWTAGYSLVAERYGLGEHLSRAMRLTCSRRPAVSVITPRSTMLRISRGNLPPAFKVGVVRHCCPAMNKSAYRSRFAIANLPRACPITSARSRLKIASKRRRRVAM